MSKVGQDLKVYCTTFAKYAIICVQSFRWSNFRFNISIVIKMEGELFPFLFVDSADQKVVKTVVKKWKFGLSLCLRKDETKIIGSFLDQQ